MGKVPTHPEFLSHRTGFDPAQSFEDWLEAGIGMASHRFGPAWTNAFEVGGVQGFVWHAPRGSKCEFLLSGIMFPSCDSVGRHFPLAVATDIPERLVKHAPHLVPLAFGDFLERAHEAAAPFPTLPPGELLGRIAAVGPPTEDDVARAGADYDAWVHATPAALAWSAVFGDHPVERSHLVLESLRQATASGHPFTVRLPLGGGGPASAALWLDVLRRLCRSDGTVPSTFWGVESGSLVIALGDADPGVLSALWYRDMNGDGIFEPALEEPPPSLAPVSIHFSMPPPPSGRGAEQALRFDGPMSNLLASLTR